MWQDRLQGQYNLRQYEWFIHRVTTTPNIFHSLVRNLLPRRRRQHRCKTKGFQESTPQNDRRHTRHPVLVQTAALQPPEKIHLKSLIPSLSPKSQVHRHYINPQSVHLHHQHPTNQPFSSFPLILELHDTPPSPHLPPPSAPSHITLTRTDIPSPIDHCTRFSLPTPIFSIVSDRRGGRTAWSSTVTISGHHVIQARFWYDGQYVNNAKEDAAEVALQQLMMGGGAAANGRGAAAGAGMAGRGEGSVWRGAAVGL